MAKSETPSETTSGNSDATLYQVARGVATITLNRPERKNSLGEELVESLAGDLDRAMTDAAVRAVVLTNVGNTFCAGADLKADRPGVPDDDRPRRTFVDVMDLILDGPKPVLGRIDGHVTGGGVGLVAACDISIMRDDAKIGFAEVRLGVAPAVISVVCLPKMRRADASELFLTGERFTPARAAEVGLINRAVPAAELDEAVDRYLSMLVRGGPLALAACKELVSRLPGMDDRDEAFAWAAARSQALFASDEAAAGIAAFRQRRDAPWVPASD
ncbi:MAG: enoyl-CoA hydratase/isomerase family protein [Acidimicrobiales bacterium]